MAIEVSETICPLCPRDTDLRYIYRCDECRTAEKALQDVQARKNGQKITPEKTTIQPVPVEGKVVLFILPEKTEVVAYVQLGTLTLIKDETVFSPTTASLAQETEA